MKTDERDRTFEVLRELPVEVSTEQVGAMVAAFALAPVASSWFAQTLSHFGKINLNSILMTSAGTIIIAGSVYLLGTKDPAPPIKAPMDEASTPAAVEVLAGPTEEPPADPLPLASGELKEERNEPVMPRKEEALRVLAPVAPTPPSRTISVIAAPNGVMQVQECQLLIPEKLMDPRTDGKTFDLSGFKAVAVIGSMDVVLEQGEFSIRAEGDPTLIERLDPVVKDGKLFIAMKGKEEKGDCHSAKGMIVHVTLPVLEGIELTGSGDVMAGSFNGAGGMLIDLQGSGDIHFESLKGLKDLTVDLDGSGDIIGDRAEVTGKTRISLAGSGDVRLEGHTNVLHVSVFGSGDVEVSGLLASECDAEVVGSGDIHMDCVGRVQQRTVGSGAINNTGNADEGGTQGQGSHNN